MLDAASPASKEADLFWMNDVWQRYLGDIAKARRLIRHSWLPASIRCRKASLLLV